MLVPYLIIVASVCMGLLWIMWVIQIGFLRGTLAGICRICWVAPVFLAFFPETTAQKLPAAVALRPLHVLVDDSASMRLHAPVVNEALNRLEQRCTRLGCALKTVKLSSIKRQTVERGFSPLNEGIKSWLFGIGAESWLFLSDGGDWHPTVAWSEKLRGMGTTSIGKARRGYILGYVPSEQRNIWISGVDVAPFSFQDQPIEIRTGLARAPNMSGAMRAQLQVAIGDETVGSVNAEFKDDEQELDVRLTIHPLEKGQHLLSVRALPVGGEKALWDNNRYAQVEVLPNTVGVLHLLGAPSWDGRFLRRFLKAEPKYDLISFFILRDPWDSQQVSERELSLIPFPTKRLFEDELPNFRVVVIQNFALFQFLEQPYQENLVKFVKEGGSMLFVGGPRALQSGDIASSALAEILPFEAGGQGAFANIPIPFGAFTQRKVDKTGPYFDKSLLFRIEPATPGQASRSLANVIDDWEAIAEELGAMDNAVGLHHMENVKFKKSEYTPLLNAKLKDGQTVPLAVASYPGKGRALWLFTDSMWRLGMQRGDKVARQTYHRFMQASMRWLMREEIRKPLVAKNFRLVGAGDGKVSWQVELQGPATRYFRRDGDWNFSVCGRKVVFDEFSFDRVGLAEILMSGKIDLGLTGGARCRFSVAAEHVAFGLVKSEITTVFPRTYADSEVNGSRFKLNDLAKITGAGLLVNGRPLENETFDAWLGKISGNEGVGIPFRYRSSRNFYWVLNRWWFWLLLAFLPLEIIVRKWHQLAGVGAPQATVARKIRMGRM